MMIFFSEFTSQYSDDDVFFSEFISQYSDDGLFFSEFISQYSDDDDVSHDSLLNTVDDVFPLNSLSIQ